MSGKVSTSGFIEYSLANGDVWRVESGRELREDFVINGADPEILAEVVRWHGALSTVGNSSEYSSQAWKVLARKYAVTPLFGQEDPEELRPWSHEHIAERFAIQSAQVQHIVVESRSFWMKWRNAHSTEEEKAQRPQVDLSGKLETSLVDALLKREGFDDVRDPEERAFIGRRIIELEDQLALGNQRTMVVSLIRQEAMITFVIDRAIQACRNEIVRADTALRSSQNEQDRLLKLVEGRNKMQAALRESMKDLGLGDETTDENKRRIGFQNTISGMVAAVAAYEQRGDTALIDGIFTANEIRIMTEPFDVRPQQYRPDLIVTVPEAIEHLFDPDFKMPSLPAHIALRLRKGFEQGLALARAENGETIGELDPEGGSKRQKDAGVAEAESERQTALILGPKPPAADYAPPKDRARKDGNSELSDY